VSRRWPQPQSVPVAWETFSTTCLIPVALVNFSTVSPNPFDFMTSKILIFSTPAGRRTLLRTALPRPQFLASPVTGCKFVSSGTTLMASFKALTGSGRVVMTVALSPEVDELLLAARASLNHHLLASSVRPSRAVAFHLTLSRHINYWLHDQQVY